MFYFEDSNRQQQSCNANSLNQYTMNNNSGYTTHTNPQFSNQSSNGRNLAGAQRMQAMAQPNMHPINMHIPYMHPSNMQQPNMQPLNMPPNAIPPNMRPLGHVPQANMSSHCVGHPNQQQHSVPSAQVRPPMPPILHGSSQHNGLYNMGNHHGGTYL